MSLITVDAKTTGTYNPLSLGYLNGIYRVTYTSGAVNKYPAGNWNINGNILIGKYTTLTIPDNVTFFSAPGFVAGAGYTSAALAEAACAGVAIDFTFNGINDISIWCPDTAGTSDNLGAVVFDITDYSKPPLYIYGHISPVGRTYNYSILANNQYKYTAPIFIQAVTYTYSAKLQNVTNVAWTSTTASLGADSTVRDCTTVSAVGTGASPEADIVITAGIPKVVADGYYSFNWAIDIGSDIGTGTDITYKRTETIWKAIVSDARFYPATRTFLCNLHWYATTSMAISGIVGTTTLATATLASGASSIGLVIGDKITITGTTHFNGTATVTYVSTTQVKWVVAQAAYTDAGLVAGLIVGEETRSTELLADGINHTTYPINMTLPATGGYHTVFHNEHGWTAGSYNYNRVKLRLWHSPSNMAISGIVGTTTLATATLTTSGASAGLTVGDTIIVTGTTHFNGTVVVTYVSATQVKWVVAQAAYTDSALSVGRITATGGIHDQVTMEFRAEAYGEEDDRAVAWATFWPGNVANPHPQAFKATFVYT